MKKIFKWLSKYEFLFAIIFILVGVAVAQWTLIITPNNLYPRTDDAMGHLAKIRYMADVIREGVWPSWFPYWYNGSTTIQYYPPLSYLWAVPVQILTDNVMITFKWLTISSAFIGAMGIWIICYRFIGPWVGLAAAVTYTMQPFINTSLQYNGVIAQVLIFALSPWLIFFTLRYLRSEQRKYWLATALVMTALILSHAMHAFMIAMCAGILVVFCTLVGLNRPAKFWGWVGSIIGSAGLSAFWWIPGVTGLETPGVPYLLPELAQKYTASIEHFNITNPYFTVSLLAISLLTIGVIIKRRKSDQNTPEEAINRLGISLFISLVFSICLSFGYKWGWVFSLIPMHESLVTLRILSYTAIIGSVLLAVLIYKISQSKNIKPIAQGLLIIFLLTLVLADERPLPKFRTIDNYAQSEQDVSLAIPDSNQGEQGRLGWVYPVDSELTYIPLLNNIMLTGGWNIEGTPHNQTVWNQNIAIPAGCPDYIIRNLYQFNVRSLFVDNQYQDVKKSLEEHSFNLVEQDANKSIYNSYIPSSYTMELKRNTLVIGRTAAGMVITYPWMIQGRYSGLENYPLELLKHFRLIYLIDPEVRDLNQFEKIVRELVDEGLTVIIEPGSIQPPPYFGIVPYAETNAQASNLVTVQGSEIQVGTTPLTGIQVDAPFIAGLDRVLLETDEAGEKGPVVGYKNVGKGKVYFVGLGLSQQLEATWIQNRGMDQKAPNGAAMRMVMEKILDLGQPYKDINPVAIPTSNISWRPDGFSFNYDAPTPLPAWVSVTYTPRWQATIDGKKRPIYSLENLILLDLPAGKHTVNFRYGITWVGILGMIVTGITIIFITLVVINPRWLAHLRAWLARGTKNTVRELFYQ